MRAARGFLTLHFLVRNPLPLATKSGHITKLARPNAVTKQQIARKVERAGTVYEMTVNPVVTAKDAGKPAISAADPATDPLGIPLPEPMAKV